MGVGAKIPVDPGPVEIIKMLEISKKQQEELFFMLERESKKLIQVFSNIKLKDKKYSQVFNLSKTYFQDMQHFLDKKEYVKAFELENYVWGLLDALAIAKAINVPARMRGWFKAEF